MGLAPPGHQTPINAADIVLFENRQAESETGAVPARHIFSADNRPLFALERFNAGFQLVGLIHVKSQHI